MNDPLTLARLRFLARDRITREVAQRGRSQAARDAVYAADAEWERLLGEYRAEVERATSGTV